MTKNLFLCLFFLLLPVSVIAKEAEPETYGVGLVCPRSDLQVSFYTENDQQDAAGTIAYGAGTFTLASDTVKSLESAGARTMSGLCEGGATGIRIDAKRDGWLQAGTLWLPPNQEWDYGDWQDYLRKSAIWKPLAPIVLYQGTADAPMKDKPYPSEAANGRIEIYPLKFVDDYALVMLDSTGAFARACAGNPPEPPQGKLGWLPLSTPAGAPIAVPTHVGGACQ